MDSLCIFLTDDVSNLPFSPSLPTPTLCVCVCVYKYVGMYVQRHRQTLKISNCRSNRHIPLCSERNSEFLPLPITYLLILPSSLFPIFVNGTTVNPLAQVPPLKSLLTFVSITLHI